MLTYILFSALFIIIYFVLKKKNIEEAFTLAINSTNDIIMYSELDKIRDSSFVGNKRMELREFEKVITSAKDYLWALDKYGKAWFVLHKETIEWTAAGTKIFKDLTTDNNHVWGIGEEHRVYKRPVNGSGDWVDEGNDVKNKKFNQISASGNEFIWAVDVNNKCWKKRKDSAIWISEVSGIQQVSGGKTFVFAITSGGDITKNKLWKKKINGTGRWISLNKKLKYVSGSSQTYLWGIKPNGKLVRALKPVGTDSTWEEVSHAPGENYKYISGENMYETKKTGIIVPSSANVAAVDPRLVVASTNATTALLKKERLLNMTRKTPVGTSTGLCSLNCSAPTKVNGACQGDINNNPIAKDINGTLKYFKECPYTCLGPQDTGWNNYGPPTGVDYSGNLHGCRVSSQCKQCGTVDIEMQGEMKETLNNGKYEYEWVGAEPTGSRTLPFSQNRKMSKCEIGRMQGLHNKECPVPSGISGEDTHVNADGTVDGTANGMVNAADTTMANMFLDINNPNDTGTLDMSLEDYYNKRLLINSGENRLGGSKSAYTNKYKPQNKFGKVRFFNSVWKLF